MGSGSSAGWRRVLLAVVLVIALSGGVAIGSMMAGGEGETAGNTTEVSSNPGSGASTSTSQIGAGSPPTLDPPDRTGACSDLEPGEPFLETDSAAMIDLGESNGVRVEGVVYPRPTYEGNPWSQWGQGLVLQDGRFFSAIGDHIGPDGNSYIFEYDPASSSLTRVGDLLSYVDHEAGSWGYGKVHGQMVGGPCGEIYFSSYWGSSREIRFDSSYRGDLLFRIDPGLRTIDPLSVPVDQHGQASLAGWAEGGLLYGEAIDPVLMNEDIEQGPFFVFDMVSEEMVFQGPDSPHVGFRNLIVDAEGRAYYSIGGGQLAVYDPSSNEISTHPHDMPADWLRASTAPAPDGRIAAVTDEPYTFFVLHPSGEIQTLAPARGYTASMVMDPDGEHFYYIPDAHGGSAESGTPLVRVDIGTGEEEVVVELNLMAEQHLGLTLGGSYSVAFDASGKKLFVGLNAGLGVDDVFGEVVLLAVHLP